MKAKITDNTKFDVMQSAVHSKLRRAMEAVGLQAEGDTRKYIDAYHAVDTGNMKKTTTHNLLDYRTAVISSPAEYSGYVHDGTSRMAARPFMRDAINNNMDNYCTIIREAMKS